MKLCGGTLVVDDDGTPVLCSHDTGSEGCSDHAFERHRVFLAAALGGVADEKVLSPSSS